MTVNIAPSRAASAAVLSEVATSRNCSSGFRKRGTRTQIGSSSIGTRAAGGQHSGPASCQVRSGLAEDPGDKPGALRTILTNGWLPVLCFAFSRFRRRRSSRQNRATAESAQEQALSEGLAPLMGWVQGADGPLIVGKQTQRRILNFNGVRDRRSIRWCRHRMIHQIYVQAEDQDR